MIKKELSAIDEKENYLPSFELLKKQGNLKFQKTNIYQNRNYFLPAVCKEELK